MAAKRVHIVVRGLVQGVFFRAHTARAAEALSLTGWVKNMPDGGVEVVAEGEDADLKKLVEWCHRGPPQAGVSSVRAEYLEHKGEFNTFEIRYY